MVAAADEIINWGDDATSTAVQSQPKRKPQPKQQPRKKLMRKPRTRTAQPKQSATKKPKKKTTTKPGNAAPKKERPLTVSFASVPGGSSAAPVDVERASLLLQSQGLCILKGTSGCLSAARLGQLKDAAQATERLVLQTCGRRGLTPRTGFAFREVASRCAHRIDVRMQSGSGSGNSSAFSSLVQHFTRADVVRNPRWWPLVQRVLGKDAKLAYCGLVLSQPGSKHQPWHVDGPHLKRWPAAASRETALAAAKDGTLPIHALNVFVPLIRYRPEHGPTELVPGSHELAPAARLHKIIARQQELAKARRDDDDGSSDDDDDDDDDWDGEEDKGGGEAVSWVPPGTVAPLLALGDALVYDQRTIHRGTPNTSHETRPLLYLLYKRPWYSETLNFGSASVFGGRGSGGRKGKKKGGKRRRH